MGDVRAQNLSCIADQDYVRFRGPFNEENPMDDAHKIRETVQVYFDSLFESDVDKVHAAFHPNAKITGYLPAGLAEMSVQDFAHFVGAQPSAKTAGESAYLEIITLEIAGATAVVQLRDDYIGSRFLDTLSCLKVDDRWVIYNKLFHVEGPAGG